MSWNTFKSTLLPSMQSNVYGNNIAGFSKLFTTSYDIAIKSGFDSLNKVPLALGNTVLMESTLTALLVQTQLSTTLTFLDVVGPAIIGYWVGAQLSNFPPPIIPAVGTIQNISTLSGIVLSPGVWTALPVTPNNNSSIFLDAFINSAKIHLTTVSGIFSVIGQYPPPAPAAPAILPWSGYNVIG
jgi:hypothetical protein